MEDMELEMGISTQQERRQKNDYIKSNYDKDTISFVFVKSMIQSHWKWKGISSEIFINVF